MEYRFGKRRVFAGAVCLLSLVAPLSLLGKQYSFKVYSQQDGLRDQVINCLLQDHKGFLWVGTQNGLYRYDGNRFASFAKTGGLPDQTIQSLYESPDGTLWVGTPLGVATFDGEQFSPDRDLGKQPLFGYSNIVADSQRRIFIGTANGLAVRQQAAPPRSQSGFKFLTNRPVHGVYADPSGTIWFGTENKLWYLRDGISANLGKESGLPDDRWDSMLLDHAGTFWVRSSERLFYRRKDSLKFQAVPGIPHSPEFGFLYQTQDGRIFVPTDEALMSYSGGRWERIGSRQGLVSDEATCLLQDREGSVWIGLGGEGLERWLGFNQWESWRAADGLTSNIVWMLRRDSSGRMWVGTENGLLAQDENTGDWVYKAGRGLSVRALAPDAEHHFVWYGANPGGVFRLNVVTGKIQHFGAGSGITNDRIDNLFFDEDHDLWAATRAGLFRGKVTEKGVHFALQDLPYSDGAESFYGHLFDHLGRLWVTGSRGVVLLDKGHWRRFSRSDGLLADGASHITESPDGAIWLGYLSNSGISRLVYKNDRSSFTHFTTKNGLTSNGTVLLGTDGNGRVWAGSDDGIDVYDQSKWQHYGKADGLVWDDCDSLAFLADNDGSVWIGTSGGISRFRPPQIRPANSEPQPYITSVAAGSRFLNPNENISIPYGDRSLLINFASPTFLNESAVRFRYRMVGLGQEWVDSEDRWVRYPSLAAGGYSFQVKARNAQGVWSASAVSTNFTILPPWWQTWPFRIAVAVLVGSLSKLLWSFRIRYLVKKQEQLVSLLSQAQNANRLKSEALAKVTQGEARERNRSHVLELIGSHQPLGAVLESIVNMVESDDPGTSCLILILQSGKFHYGASMRLPQLFAASFEGLPSNAERTCFASAAQSVKPISVEDVATDPLWCGHLDILSDLQITSTLSTPILSSSATVLGTVTCFRQARVQDEHGIMVSQENATRLAAVAIEHVSLYEQLSYRAQYDNLTGLPNRILFHDRLCQAIARARRYGGRLYVLGIDLDGFKHVNDTMGHQAGDSVLKEVAHRISGCLRRSDTAARMGGDEFTILLESTNEGQLENFGDPDVDSVVRKLIAAIGEPIPFENREACVTASVGVSIYPDDAQDADALMRNADTAMYHVKRLGKNAYEFFGPEIGSHEFNRIELESCLRNALAAQEFELYYQPQYRLDRTLSGFEALLRWNSPKLGKISPGVFIPIAEQTGLIVPIGQWVLEEACRQTALWNDAGYEDFRVAVNVSAFQFARPDFPEAVAQFLRVMGVSPQQIELELTETAIMTDVAKSSAQLRELREFGLAVWIDDFGTGYSSLSYLQRLPVDGIKIDQSFVKDLSADRTTALPMIEAIVKMAHDLNLRVIAEGVETEEQMHFLKSTGCDLAQGYLLNRPLALADATALLSARKRLPETSSEEVLALG